MAEFKPEERRSVVAEIAAFAKKLEQWGESLPEAERPLAQILAQRARELREDDVRKEALRTSLRDATRDAFRAIGRRFNQGVEGWVKIGPIWYKKNEVDFGEEVELLQRVELRARL